MRDILRLAVGAIPNAEDGVTAALAWALAAGAMLGPRAECVEVRDGVLWLRAKDADAQGAINSISGDLCRSLNRSLPNSIRRIAFLP